MKRWIASVAALVALAGCSSERSGEIETDDGTVSYTTDSAGNSTTTTITTEEGTATFTKGGQARATLPDGYTLFPGAKVMSNVEADGDGGKVNMILFQTEASPEDLESHYRKEAEAAGVKIELQMTMENGRVIGGKTPDGSNFALTANSDGQQTTATLTIGKE